MTSFDQMMIAEITELKSLTLWRVGVHAEGPGREPREGVARVAFNNHLAWAFSIDGDGRFDGTALPGATVESSVSEAQAAVVALVEEATNRRVTASWAEVDADTWAATASFAD